MPAAPHGRRHLPGGHNKMFPVPFGTRTRVRFGDPIERQAGEDPAELMEKARAEIAATLQDWRNRRK